LLVETLQGLPFAGRKKAGEYITQVTALGPPGLEFSMPPAIRANEAREIHDARAIGRGNRQS
jgi:hypothetical protein